MIQTAFSAFWVGGLCCLIAQLLMDLTALTPARILVIYVVFGVGLSAVGWFEPIKEFAECGITVPLIGFGGLIGEGVKKAVAEQGALGIFSGGFTAAAAGCTAALVFGYLAAVLFTGKPKRMS